MLVRRVGICLQLRESQSSTRHQSIRSLVQDSEYTNPAPAQRRQKEKEGTGGWPMRMIVVVDTGRISKRSTLCYASHRMETPIRNLDHSSHRHRGLRKSSSTLSPSKSLRLCHVNVLVNVHTESPPRAVAPHQWSGSRMGIRHRVGGAR